MSAFQTVLVVDEQSAFRCMIETMLTQLHHTVHLAENGKQALHFMERLDNAEYADRKLDVHLRLRARRWFSDGVELIDNDDLDSLALSSEKPA